MVHAEKTNAPVLFLTCPIILSPISKEGNSFQFGKFRDFRQKKNKDKNKTSLLHLHGLQRLSKEKKIVPSAMVDFFVKQIF